MIKISHRINTIELLKSTPTHYGIELDLRDSGKDIIIAHDAFTDGEKLEDYLKHYKHRFMIANIKSEGIELKALELLKKYNVDDFFFLDLSFPAVIKLNRLGEKRIALRFSEFEGTDTLMNMKGNVDWVWVDCFNQFALDQQNYQILKKYFKLCLVSPELQGHSVASIREFKEKANEMSFDVVCTKRIDLWN